MSAASNVEVSYLYRDAGNYKQFGSIVFFNRSGAQLSELSEKLSSALIDGIFFVAELARVPSLFFKDFPFNPDLDHDWHEFEAITYTDKEVDDAYHRDVSVFVKELGASK